LIFIFDLGQYQIGEVQEMDVLLLVWSVDRSADFKFSVRVCS